MASQYKNLRCTGCDGTLEYNKEKKVWVCIYCGNEIRREEEYDGLYTIKNVVKQVLVDLAYGRMDSAQKNLIECEKISSDYIGTIIASICYKVFTIITPGACQQSEVKGLFGQIKRLLDRLESIDMGISAEEEGLYEAFDGNNDAFGVLILVFDTLKAKTHLEFVNKFFDGSTVYSPGLNANLLNYALRNNIGELTDKIFSNSDNINCRESLFILLDSYHDCPQKIQYMETLFSKAELKSDDYKLVEKYLKETADGLDTKVVLYSNAVKYRISPSIQTVMSCILSDKSITGEQVTSVIGAFADTHPKDSELYEFLEQIYTKHSGNIANTEFQILLDSELFIKPSDKDFRYMVNRRDWSVEDRNTMIDKSMKCNIDVRAKDAILAEILLYNEEDTDTRILLINKMLEYVDTISTNTMTDYILKCEIDGERKPEVLRLLLKLDLNMSFFREVLSKYLQTSTDSENVKKEISQELSNCGLQVDSKVLLDMAREANNENHMEVVAFLQKAIKNGTRMSTDAASEYLEKVEPENYHTELISLLYHSMSQITDKALANYVLYASESYDLKLKNSVDFAGQNMNRFGSSPCTVKYLDSELQCNLLQAYVLMTKDSAEIVGAMIAAMKNAGSKLSDNITVNGQMMRFKKFAMDYKTQLSQETLTILEENKVFSFFFN